MQSSSLCTQYQGILNDQQTATTAARVLLPVGAGALVVGAVLFLWPSGAGARREAVVTPVIGPTTAGLQVGGRF